MKFGPSLVLLLMAFLVAWIWDTRLEVWLLVSKVSFSLLVFGGLGNGGAWTLWVSRGGASTLSPDKFSSRCRILMAIFLWRIIWRV